MVPNPSEILYTLGDLLLASFSSSLANRIDDCRIGLKRVE